MAGQLMHMSYIMWLEQQMTKGNIPSDPTPTPTPSPSPEPEPVPPEPEPIVLPPKTWRARYELTPDLLEDLEMTYDEVFTILLQMPEMFAEQGADINLENSSVTVVKQEGNTLILDVTLDCEDWYKMHSAIEVEFIAFGDLSDVTDMRYMFSGYFLLEKAPALNAPNVTECYGMFEHCMALTSIHENLLPNLTLAGNYMFGGCTALTSIPENLFPNLTTAGNGTFSGCTGLISIPENLFPNLTEGYEMFSGCTGLTSIPENLFPNLTDGHYMFKGCTGLISIPENLFPNLTEGYEMFKGCTGLTSIPENLFPNLVQGFAMFDGCTGLVSIPENVFPYLTDGLFMFNGCTGLTSIPENLFPSLTRAWDMFNGCTGLTSIPENLFPSLVDSYSMFKNCINVQSGALGLYRNWLAGGKVISHSSTFENCGKDTKTGLEELQQIPQSWGGLAEG